MEKNLIKVLNEYGIKGVVEKTNNGPLVTQIVFHPASGTKLKKITDSIADIGRELGVSGLRAEQIPNSDDIGFEIPNDKPQTVDFAAMLTSAEFKNAKGDLPITLGVDIAGVPVLYDLAAMPHLLVAGTTGSGKSVGLNTFILSLIKRFSPDDIKFVLIDPKAVEFSTYNNQKFMLCPVVTDNAEAAATLAYLVNEMNDRYQTLQAKTCKNIGDYNARGGKMPRIICVIDEFADLIMSDKKVGASIMMLAQKARAAGIHIILSTQRPSVDIVTGALKANLPTRLAYKVATMTDSRTILDRPGAEDLIGRGDSLFLAPTGALTRIHGAYIADDAIDAMLKPYRGRVDALPLQSDDASADDVAPARASSRPASGSSSRPAPAPRGRAQKSLPEEALETWNKLPAKTKSSVLSGVADAAGFIFKSFFGGKK
ncbi:MAG: FtsK/SpoIIIE domain-containing protein [Proteobacteria bacterium]|nr:FtsK/SpoIIIE domain-containing protein [Pseudomonadota bacterium]